MSWRIKAPDRKGKVQAGVGHGKAALTPATSRPRRIVLTLSLPLA
jgi:hypothetical protein